MEYSWEADVKAVFSVVPLNLFLWAAAAYLPFVFLLQRSFRKASSLDLSVPLALWNAFLSIGSGYCAFFVWRDLLIPLVNSEDKFCNFGVYQHVSSRFVILFNLTKALEWIDTLFLVVKKKELGFLHLFHHLVTMLYCLHATVFSFSADASGVYFCGMNLAVHAVMYGYWAVQPYVKWLRYFSWLITVMQLTQMAVGVAVTMNVTLACPQSWALNWHGDLFALAMYAVYFYLFLELLLQKVRSGSGSKRAATSKDATKGKVDARSKTRKAD